MGASSSSDDANAIDDDGDDGARVFQFVRASKLRALRGAGGAGGAARGALARRTLPSFETLASSALWPGWLAHFRVTDRAALSGALARRFALTPFPTNRGARERRANA